MPAVVAAAARPARPDQVRFGSRTPTRPIALPPVILPPESPPTAAFQENLLTALRTVWHGLPRRWQEHLAQQKLELLAVGRPFPGIIHYVNHPVSEEELDLEMQCNADTTGQPASEYYNVLGITEMTPGFEWLKDNPPLDRLTRAQTRALLEKAIEVDILDSDSPMMIYPSRLIYVPETVLVANDEGIGAHAEDATTYNAIEKNTAFLTPLLRHEIAHLIDQAPKSKGGGQAFSEDPAFIAAVTQDLADAQTAGTLPDPKAHVSPGMATYGYYLPLHNPDQPVIDEGDPDNDEAEDRSDQYAETFAELASAWQGGGVIPADKLLALCPRAGAWVAQKLGLEAA